MIHEMQRLRGSIGKHGREASQFSMVYISSFQCQGNFCCADFTQSDWAGWPLAGISIMWEGNYPLMATLILFKSRDRNETPKLQSNLSSNCCDCKPLDPDYWHPSLTSNFYHFLYIYTHQLMILLISQIILYFLLALIPGSFSFMLHFHSWTITEYVSL